MRDNRFAKYVENHISFNDLRAFVFQRKDDMERFMEEVRSQRRGQRGSRREGDVPVKKTWHMR